MSDFQSGNPGVYEGVRAEEYHAFDACSSSRLAKLARSPMHCRDSIADKSRTKAMKLGNAAHLYVLQPELVAAYYSVSGPCVAPLASGSRKGEDCGNAGTIAHGGAWYCGTHDPRKRGVEIDADGREVLSADENDACVAMRQSVLEHAKARDLFDGPGPTELSILWKDKETGILCKARIDKLNTRLGAIADLKTTESAQREAFQRKIYQFGYHIQSGMYVNGAHEVGLDARHFIIVPVEKKSPWTPAAYRFKDPVVSAGWSEARRLIRIYARCLDTGDWPGYGDSIEDIDLPDWDWRKLTQEGDDE